MCSSGCQEHKKLNLKYEAGLIQNTCEREVMHQRVVGV